jgi:subtilisin family serine protease
VAKKANAGRKRPAPRGRNSKVADDAKPDQAEAKPERERPMQFSIPAELVEHILLGPADDRRVLQDSPLLGDVWAAYALDPGNIQDVLITPHKSATAAGVASKIPDGLKEWKAVRATQKDPKPAERAPERAKIAYLQGLVGARLRFDEVLCILVPMSQWWHQPNVAGRIEKIEAARLKELLELKVEKPGIAPAERKPANFNSLERYIALAGLIYWIGKLERPAIAGTAPPKHVARLPLLTIEDAFEKYQPHIDEIIAGMFSLYATVKTKAAAESLAPSDSGEDSEDTGEGSIFQVSLNRVASAALERSVPAVKADAAHSLFKVNCKGIVWAVLDSGIDSTHDAFMTVDEKKTTDPDRPQYMSRVRKTFDFTRIREIVSNDDTDLTPEDIKSLAAATGLQPDAVEGHLKTIAKDAKDKRPINWAVVEKLITLKPKQKPPKPGKADAGTQQESAPGSFGSAASGKPEPEKSGPGNSGSEECESDLHSPHGTHVAGIIGADQSGYGNKDNKYAGGMCPDIRLYDFRVLGKTMEDTEFAVIAALQYIRYVNERHTYITIHGANLSLSILHNVRNYACGRTPVCNECERLVESGVVVVAAAGNRGFQKFEIKDGPPFENYAAFSITDPGNSDGVITVGSTHGNWPHTYGVSFFSSRGPTGDGRLKPDLVAPGERVQSTIPGGNGNEWGPESGTSMAAPHVSGAAAMLLARYDELIGQPRRVKRILCESATDLGRERSFQGHGMLDVLRAFQSI